ncbi:hypothetical protein AB0942_17380 [Streptomyces nodosus]|uniref:hypothetical protein n=1 Tax=Streptomyces nodosus TaxID=40318 RepID=UPI0034566640
MDDHGIEPAAVMLTARSHDDAVRRVLATKASLRLHRPANRPERWTSDPEEERSWRRELAEASITLVKDTQSLLPLTAGRFRRVLVYALGTGATSYDPTPSLAERFANGLRARGMSVDLRAIPGERRTALTVSRLHRAYDLCVYFANVRFIGNSNTSGCTGRRDRAPTHHAMQRRYGMSQRRPAASG